MLHHAPIHITRLDHALYSNKYRDRIPLKPDHCFPQPPFVGFVELSGCEGVLGTLIDLQQVDPFLVDPPQGPSLHLVGGIVQNL